MVSLFESFVLRWFSTISSLIIFLPSEGLGSGGHTYMPFENVPVIKGHTNKVEFNWIEEGASLENIVKSFNETNHSIDLN